MRTFNRLVITVLSLATVIAVAGLVGRSENPRAASDPQAARIAVQVWSDSLSVVIDDTEVAVEPQSTPAPTPTATPTATPNPTATPAPTASPCPDNVHITTTGPGSSVQITCTGSSSTSISSSSSVTVRSSSTQTSSGGSSHNSSTTNISITND